MLRYLSAETELPADGDPLLLVAKLAESGLFDQYVVYEREGDYCFAGGALGEVVVGRSGIRRRWLSEEIVEPLGPHPLRQVGEKLAEMGAEGWNAHGWMAFEFSHLYTDRPDRAGDADLLHLAVPHTEVRFRQEHAEVRGADRETLNAVLELLAEPVSRTPVAPRPIEVADVSGRYPEIVARAIEEIRSGTDLQKVILSRSVPVPFPVDFVATYVHGRTHNTPARSFLLRLGGRHVAGFSPETVAEVSADGEVVTQPLAGTRARGFGGAEDERLRAELLADPKEISEHVLSVKLAEEEMGTVCRPGTVSVRDLLSVRRRGSVQHLGSSVHGLLADGATAWDVLRAVFPAVTASGIPKLPAYERITRLEGGHRGIYSGAVLQASSDGSLDAALVLRSVFEEDGRTWLRAGAGILAGSTPARELEETCEKLRSVAPYVVPAQPAARG
uniref:Salicylate synthase n=1 Tax=Streptomyces gandocaensis TaxID=1649596 RepID=A0A140DJY2_9ACTN|nr:salicylate synthase [Streptomyces gandocaensis]